MDNNINKINNHTNSMLNDYKNLVMDYEDCRELYATATEDSAFPCRYILAYNDSLTVTQFALYQVPINNQVFMSNHINSSEYFLIDLNNLSLPSGTKFQLKAFVTMGADSISNVILKKVSDSSVTAYFELKGTAFNTHIDFFEGNDPH